MMGNYLIGANDEELLDILYEEYEYQYGKLKRINSDNIDLYIELEDINKICNKAWYINEMHSILNYLNSEPLIELLTKERLENKIYAKLNNKNIRIYQGEDNNYYTCEKVKISDIELKYMKSLKDYIESTNLYE